MITYRSFVGLDVHARTIVGCAIDDQTGEIMHRRFGCDLAEVAAWMDSLPAPQTATYEAGPTGFGLFRRSPKKPPGIWSVPATTADKI